ncbi:MAG: hypothetical protein JO249_04920 [Acidobacteria bacterium]|nr:hypothetical protein [Acidobacteriota bacterium]
MSSSFTAAHVAFNSDAVHNCRAECWSKVADWRMAEAEIPNIARSKTASAKSSTATARSSRSSEKEEDMKGTQYGVAGPGRLPHNAVLCDRAAEAAVRTRSI